MVMTADDQARTAVRADKHSADCVPAHIAPPPSSGRPRITHPTPLCVLKNTALTLWMETTLQAVRRYAENRSADCVVVRIPQCVHLLRVPAVRAEKHNADRVAAHIAHPLNDR